MTKLHLGCGKRDFGSEWDHIDGGDFPHLKSHDIINLPYSDNSVDLIYASHVLEYFDREEAAFVLKEWNRVLVPSGILRLAVPDFEQMCKLYYEKEFPLKNFLGPLYGKMTMSNKSIYHKTTYDYEDIKSLLKNCGFMNVYRYNWRTTEHSHIDDHSMAHLPHMDKEDGTLISLNVEAIK
jgi:predicted SAM-dependent methyltransferase